MPMPDRAFSCVRSATASGEVCRRSSISSSDSASSSSPLEECLDGDNSASVSEDMKEASDLTSCSLERPASFHAKAFTRVISGCLCATRPVFCCGGRVLACCRGEDVCLFNIQNGELLYTCEGHDSKICALIAVPAKVFPHLPSVVVSFAISGEICCWEAHSRSFFYESLDEHQSMRPEEPRRRENQDSEGESPVSASRMRSLNCLRAVRLPHSILAASLAAQSLEVFVLSALKSKTSDSGCETSRKNSWKDRRPLFAVFAVPLTSLVAPASEETASAAAKTASAGISESMAVADPLFRFQSLPSALSVAPSGSLVAITSGRELLLFVRKKQLLLRLHHVDPLLQVSIHPQELFIAAGDSRGRIVLFYVSQQKAKRTLQHAQGDAVDGDGILETSRRENAMSRDESSSALSSEENNKTLHEEDRRRRRDARCSVQTVVLHWHAHAVNSLCFSADGLMLLSGGEEGVLVFWQMQHNFSKLFLPRLGAALLHLSPAWLETQLFDSASSVGVNGQNARTEHLAISCADNRIKIIDGSTLESVGCVSGVAMPLAAFSLDLHAAASVAVTAWAEAQDEGASAKSLVARCKKDDNTSSEHNRSLLPQLLFEELSCKTEMAELLSPGIALSRFSGVATENDGEFVLLTSSESALQVLDADSGAEAFRLELQRRTYTSRIDDSFGINWILQKAVADCEGGAVAVVQRRGTRVLASECLDTCSCSACAALLEGRRTTRKVAVCTCSSSESEGTGGEEEDADDAPDKAKDKASRRRACSSPCCFGDNAEGLVSTFQQLEAEPQASGLDYLLSFWVLADKSEQRQTGGFYLLNEIEGPHINDVTALLAHPTEPCCFISASLDSRFSIWKRVAFPEIDTATALSGNSSLGLEDSALRSAFICISQWSYRGLPVGCLAVSDDGSLLVAGHGDLLSLWSSEGPALLETLPLPAVPAVSSEEESASADQERVSDVCCRTLHVVEAESGLLLICSVSEYVLIYDLLDFAILWKRDFAGCVDFVFVDGACGFSVVEALGTAHRLHVFSFVNSKKQIGDKDEAALPPLAEEREMAVSAVLTDQRSLEDAVLAGLYLSNGSSDDEASTSGSVLLLLTASFSLQRIYVSDSNTQCLPTSRRGGASLLGATKEEDDIFESREKRVMQRLLEQERRLAREEQDVLRSRVLPTDPRSLAEVFCAKRSAEAPAASAVSQARAGNKGGSAAASALLGGDASAEAKLHTIFDAFTDAPPHEEPLAASTSCHVEVLEEKEPPPQRTVPASLAGVETRKPKTRALKAIAELALKSRSSPLPQEKSSEAL